MDTQFSTAAVDQMAKEALDAAIKVIKDRLNIVGCLNSEIYFSDDLVLRCLAGYIEFELDLLPAQIAPRPMYYH